MRALTGLWFAWIPGFMLAFAAGASPNNSLPDKSSRPLRVVLVGASIGQDWNLQALPARVRIPGYEFQALQAWQYDKSELLEETLMRPARRFRLTRTYFTGFFKESPQPADVIVIKECSSYFPGDLGFDAKKKMVQRWVDQVKQKNTQVMLATVVPVTKKRAMQNPGKQESVREFNDWVRAFAQQNGIVLLDLEAATRTDERDRYLRDDLDVGDGSHLNRKAYDILDGVMVNALCRLDAHAACTQSQAFVK